MSGEATARQHAGEGAELSAEARRMAGWLADRMVTAQGRSTAGLVSRVLQRVPELAQDEVLAGEVATGERTIAPAFAKSLRDPLSLIEEHVPAASTTLGRTLAQRGAPLRALVEAYRVGQSLVLERMLRALTRDARPELLSELVPFCVHRYNSLIDAIVARTIDVYTAEIDRLRGHGLARRIRMVRGLLDGSLSDEAQTSRALGHELRAHQTGMVVWSDQPDVPDDLESRMDQLAGAVALALGAARALSVPSGARSIWAWVGTRGAPDLTVLEAVRGQAVSLGLRVAVGSPSSGIAGFVATHREAVWASAVGGRMPDRQAIVTYPAVAALSLMQADQAQVRAFVRSELGGLADRDKGAQRLRETAQVFIEAGSNARLAAERLSTHKNTVLYRLRRAEVMRGRPLEERRFELEVALTLVRTLGDWALPSG